MRAARSCRLNPDSHAKRPRARARPGQVDQWAGGASEDLRQDGTCPGIKICGLRGEGGAHIDEGKGAMLSYTILSNC